MADHHQGKTGSHCGAGYAPARYPAKPGPDRNTDRGHCFAASVLCSPNGAGVYPAAPGRGDRRGEAKRRSFRQKTYGAACGVLRNPKAVARQKNIRQGGGQTAGNHPQHLFEMGKRKQRMKKYSLLTIQNTADIYAFYYNSLTIILQVSNG